MTATTSRQQPQCEHCFHAQSMCTDVSVSVDCGSGHQACTPGSHMRFSDQALHRAHWLVFRLALRIRRLISAHLHTCQVTGGLGIAGLGQDKWCQGVCFLRQIEDSRAPTPDQRTLGSPDSSREQQQSVARGTSDLTSARSRPARISLSLEIGFLERAAAVLELGCIAQMVVSSVPERLCSALGLALP